LSDFFRKIDLPPIPNDMLPSFVESLSIHKVVVLDMNLDGKLDIVFHVWGDTKTSMKSLTAEPIPDALIVYLSDANGGYYIGNLELFGSRKVELASATSRQYVIDDLNGDGYPDIAFAMNLEDGRPQLEPPFKNWWAAIGVILSNGDGTYKSMTIPILGYHHTISSIKIDEGNPYIFTAGIDLSVDRFSAAVRLEDGEWKQSDIIPAMPSARNIPLSLDSSSAYTTHIFSSMIFDNYNDLESGLYKRGDQGWDLVDISRIKASSNDVVKRLSGDSNSNNVLKTFLLGEFKIIDATIWEASTIRLYKNKDPVVLALVGGLTIRSDQVGELVRQADLIPFNFFIGLDVNNNKFTLLGDLLVNQKYHEQGYGWKVVDLNFDGYDDLVGYSQRKLTNNAWNNPSPLMVYINNQAGQLILDESYYVAPFLADQPQQVVVADFNSDGIMDVLYYSTVPKTWGLNPDGKAGWIYLNDMAYIQLGTKSQFDFSTTTIISTAGNDVLNGSDIDDIVDAGRGNDIVFAGDGNDTIMSGLGDDLLYGGAGIDTAVYMENHSSFKIIQTSDYWKVDGSSEGLGVDKLWDVERIVFSDKSIAIDLDGNAGTVAKILGAVAGRESLTNKEYVGIGLDLVDKGMSYSDLAALALQAVGLNTNDQIVTALWTNVIGSAPSAADKAPFIEMLENGFSRGELAKLAAETTENAANIGLVGLAQTGIDYLPVI
jgi:Ca2+-binding RTX toxin-like protein